MNDPLRFHLVLHDHQPFGNFPEVFEEAFETAYRPTLGALSRHPGLRFSLHCTGALWEWIEGFRPKAIDLVGEMVARGQLELIGGPFYEPVLALISRRDALGQIEKMREYLVRRFSYAPRGAWLAERVWQPDLPEVFEEAGVRFVFVDDTHLYTAGPEEDDPADFVHAESRGARVALYPIDRKLRYCIPFREPEDALARLEELAAKGVRCATYADDGEKFGLWPGTNAWVWKGGWFERFLSALEKTDSIVTAHPTETLRAIPGRGLAYPPTTSYEELGEWALPPSRQIQRHELIAELKEHDLLERARPLLRGGHFTVFLARYPEINLLHKRMLAVSQQLEQAESALGTVLEAAREAIYRSQVNCPYWHGLFGGLYAPVLRHVIPVEVQRAERLVCEALGSPAPALSADLDGDGHLELLGGPGPGRYLLASGLSGGLRSWSRWDMDDAPLDIVARRKEAYHLLAETCEASEEQHPGGPASIHDLAARIPAALLERAGWDRLPRVSGVELRIPLSLDPLDLRRGGAWKEDQFEPWTLNAVEGGTIEAAPRADPSSARRVVSFSADATEAVFEHSLARLADDERLAIEWNLALPGPGSLIADGTTLLSFDGATVGTVSGGPYREIRVERSERGSTFVFRPASELYLAAYVIETILRTESGFESVIQGLSLYFAAPAGVREITLDVRLEAP